jgi:hypothetical protein
LVINRRTPAADVHALAPQITDHLTAAIPRHIDERSVDHPRHLRGACKSRRHAVDRLPLPRRDHRVVNAVLGPQLRQRQVSADRFQRNHGLEVRALTLSRRLHSRQSFRSGIAQHPVQFFQTTSADE